MAVQTIPILPSAGFDATSSFYGRLGFVETARYPGEYLIVRHDIGIELHFFAADDVDPARNHSGCYVRFETADPQDFSLPEEAPYCRIVASVAEIEAARAEGLMAVTFDIEGMTALDGRLEMTPAHSEPDV